MKEPACRPEPTCGPVFPEARSWILSDLLNFLLFLMQTLLKEPVGPIEVRLRKGSQDEAGGEDHEGEER